MTEDIENLILEHLRRLRDGQEAMRADLHDLKVRVTAIEEGLAGDHRCMDRIDERLERVERRLELADA